MIHFLNIPGIRSSGRAGTDAREEEQSGRWSGEGD